MKHNFSHGALTAAILALGAVFRVEADARTNAQSNDSQAVVEVLEGTATFDVGTNVSAISVHGKSSQLRGRAQLRASGDAIALEAMEAAVTIATITTGLGLRDSHMRKYVFTTEDGQMPDLKFAAERAQCSQEGGGKSTCNLSGQLTIRGTPRPFTITLRVNKVGDAYRAEGDGAVKLSLYGIARPLELGVTTADDVKLHLEFTAKPSFRATARNRGDR